MTLGIHVVKKHRKHGSPVWYVYAYRGGPQIHRQEGRSKPKLTEQLVRGWLAAADERVKPIKRQPETLGDLIDLWYPSSPEWKSLAANTRKTWGSALKSIEAKWRRTPLTVWNDPRMTGKVVAWRDSRVETPRAADIGVMVLKALLKFGRLRGKVGINVAEKIPQLYRNGVRADIIWTDADMAEFARAAREMDLEHVNDGLRLASVTGLRREDLVTLTWDEVHHNAIVKLAAKVSRGKRRTATIPRLPALDELLVELQSRKRQDGVRTVLVNSYGLSWSADGFGGSFNRVRDKAGITHVEASTGKAIKKHLHDVRGTFCTKLITRGGITDQEAAGIMGWSPEQVAGIRRTYVDQGAVNMAVAARLRDNL